jgi:endonuclease III related protein
MPVALQEVYNRLLDAFGPQNWWPGDTHFEMMVGAILVQNTNWQNVERAIGSLRAADLLDPHALRDVSEEELEELIRPAGYYRVKARRLRSLIEFFVERYDGSIEAMFRTPPDKLRRELLGIHGVGPETADSILLYAGSLPTFVVDAYTHRILSRHGWIDPEADYHQIQEYFHDHLPADAAMFNDFHALLVYLGKHFCKKSKPLCKSCPLECLLPKGGPIGNDEEMRDEG